MLNIVFIILIFLEIAFLYFAIVKITELNNKIIKLNEVVIQKGKLIIDMHKKMQNIIKKINFFVSIITNEKLWRIKRIISSLIGIIELIIVLRSFKLEKGVKFNLKNIKKLLFTGLSKQLIKKVFNNLALVC